jgi:phosphatidylglycerophosphatase A
MTISPDPRFLLGHPAHFFALGFGSGLAPKAPGTFGTLVAFPLFWLLPGNWMGLAIITAAFLSGIYVCSVAGKNLGVVDHGSIVWDEIVAMLLVLHFVAPSAPDWLAAFVLFRLFDIWKPFPIRQLDLRIKNGFGVMLDDLLAAGYALAAYWGLQWLMTRF